ncbi:protein adenylyltransferase SelO [Sinimarinibacterium thermocellulolyticum]|uniref:Protein nucleotidyltransferase YdiU n=1 Tax=Sinimarinibacterium thermocellulolyticum TaxID=3170016 RepID=A0ABV2AAE9_9GAMM
MAQADDRITPTHRRLDALRIDNRFARLGEAYFSRVMPTPLTNPRLLHANADVAALLDLDPAAFDQAAFTQVFAGNAPLPGAEPLAMLYAGHQFGVWVPQLGDGRAILLAQVRNARGQSWDLQLKGAGRTPYSRFADGRAVLRSSVREYLAGEALHHLGIATTRALCLIAADDPVQRETLERAAVICRVAPSHVRFGSFEVFYDRGQFERIRVLADHVIDEHFPDLSAAPDRHARWLERLVDRTAELIAAWQSVGFCHGVMNTDNMSAVGVTLDFGPYGFIDGFDAHHICNHSDEGGRYAYDNQPRIGHWNCARLVQALVPLLGEPAERAAEIGQAIVDRYPQTYTRAMTARWRAKFGLNEVRDGDEALMNRFLTLLHRGRSDFTLSFRGLAKVRRDDDAVPAALADHILDLDALRAWLHDYRARLHAEAMADDVRAAQMNRVNPQVVLRNHLAQRVIEDCERGNTTELEQLLAALRKPFDVPRRAEFAAVPPPDARHITVSCSS